MFSSTPGCVPACRSIARSCRICAGSREEFLDLDEDYGGTIVYGHTISDEVDEAPGRIGIDTGAYLTGRLTALALEGEERWFLDTATESDDGHSRQAFLRDGRR